MTFDEKLAQALGSTAKARAEQMLIVTKKHRFSLAYRLWEYKTLRNLRKDRYDKRWTLRRARYVILAAIIASSLLLGVTAYAVGITIGRYSFDTKPDYSKLFIESISSDKTSIEKYYGLPEEDGWRIVEYFVNDTETLINYKRNEKTIYFGQRVITGYIGNVNTEKEDVEPMSLYEKNDGFFIDFGEGECSLYWIYDGYLFDLGGNITKDEALNLAYSTKIVEL